MNITPNEYVYKKEVDWSLLMDGLTLPVDNQVVFVQSMGRFLTRGESKQIQLYLQGKSYTAKLTNLNLSQKYKNRKDMYQIRYNRSSDLAKALQGCFYRSYQYIKSIRESRNPKDRSIIRLPEEYKEYLVIYTTEYPDSYVLEPIVVDDMEVLRKALEGKPEYELETEFEFEVHDGNAGYKISHQLTKVRKLNQSIGNNLKRLYKYRCQICGKAIGEEYGAAVAEAHHIDYFVNSLNNDASNQIIVCPNHHRIIHQVNPVFNRKKLAYEYENGYEEEIVLNKHL